MKSGLGFPMVVALAVAGLFLAIPVPYYIFVLRPARSSVDRKLAEIRAPSDAHLAARQEEARLIGQWKKAVDEGRDDDAKSLQNAVQAAKLRVDELTTKTDSLYQALKTNEQRRAHNAFLVSQWLVLASVAGSVLSVIVGATHRLGHGPKTGAWVGAVTGLAVGGVVGNLWSWLLIPSMDYVYLLYTPLAVAVGGAAIGAAYGAILSKLK